MKKPSDATIIKNMKAALFRIKEDCNLLRMEREKYRIRATKAEQEVSEWKLRFDTLLKRDNVIQRQ